MQMRPLFTALCLFGTSACTNVSTPAGYVGYIKSGVMFFGKEGFYGTQDGPTSSGLGWQLSVINISITPTQTTEGFYDDASVLSHDNLKVAFQIHILWKIDPTRVRDLVEKYSTLQDCPAQDPNCVGEGAYKNFLQEPLRTFARDAVQHLDALQVKDNIEGLSDQITAKAQALTKDTPFVIMQVVVGNVQYPPEIADAVAKKLAATQLLEQKQTEIEIEKREAEKRVVQAKGIADAMEIVRSKLTSNYLQHEAIEAQKDMINSPNHTVIYIPVGRMGVPLVSDVSGGGDPAPASPAVSSK